MTCFVVNHPLLSAAAATAGAFGLAAWILRFMIAQELRARRRGGFLIGGDR